ncbi:MAG: hypothetical protein IT556_06275 [Acetobacteraceae bacterium]|nr:hypothetical protein [Acetobacteraceae bacterium]
MPWWLSFALDWFPAVLVALLAGWWLDLPPGAMVLVFLMLVGLSMMIRRAARALRGNNGNPVGSGDGAGRERMK